MFSASDVSDLTFEKSVYFYSELLTQNRKYQSLGWFIFVAFLNDPGASQFVFVLVITSFSSLDGDRVARTMDVG